MAPRIDRRYLHDLTISVGTALKYEANVIGEPDPQVNWYYQSIPLLPTDTIQITNTDHHTRLVVRPATRGDSGEYKVVASNSSGKDIAIVNVVVTDKPSAPEGPIVVEDVHKNGCKLKWKRPKDDGGVPIEYYQIDKMDPETGCWVPCARSNEPSAEITGLTPGQSYKFRVSAINSEGESEPLVTEEEIVAKNPFDEPDKPQNLEATDWDKHHVDLKWTPPINDGGAPILNYVIEKKDKYGEWEKALEVPAELTKARVPDLMEGQGYEFRVRAVNKAGPSDPSNETPIIVCKPRNLPPKIDRTNLNDIRLKAEKS